MNRWWDQSAPAAEKCPTCGKPISRKRGNLSREAHRNAIAAQLHRHVLKHHAPQALHEERKS